MRIIIWLGGICLLLGTGSFWWISSAEQLAIDKHTLSVWSRSAKMVKRATHIEVLPQGHFGRLEIPLSNGKKLSLKTRSLSVKVTVRGRIARTEVTQLFYNPLPRQTEGALTFRLPYGAAITRLAMDVNGKMMEGELVERTRARAIYESIVRSMKDPALLEWQGNNRFRTQIFPIPARGTKTIIISYDHILHGSQSHFDYNYLLPQANANAKSIGKFDFSLTLYGGRVLKTAPYTTRLKTVGKKTQLTYSAKSFRPKGDLSVRMKYQAKRGALHAGIAQKKTYGLLEIPIQLKGKGRSFQHQMLLLDTSAGLREHGLIDAIQVCKDLLKTLPKGAQFGLLAGDLFVRSFAKYTRKRKFSKLFGSFMGKGHFFSQSWRKQATAFLNQQRPRGATHLERLFLAGLRHAKNNTEVVYVGDGIASLGQMDPNRLAALLKNTIGKRSIRISAVAVGPRPDLGFLRKITRVTGGRLLRLQTGQPVMESIKKFRTLLQQPQLTDIKVSVKGMKNPLRASQGNIASGSSLLLTGELNARAIKVKLEGKIDRKQAFSITRVYEPHNELSKPIVPTFWARLKIDQLQAKGKNKKKVIQLSKNYGVMSHYTSFLVLENDRAYKRHKIKRRRHKNRLKRKRASVYKSLSNKSALQGKDAKNAIKRWMRPSSPRSSAPIPRSASTPTPSALPSDPVASSPRRMERSRRPMPRRVRRHYAPVRKRPMPRYRRRVRRRSVKRYRRRLRRRRHKRYRLRILSTPSRAKVYVNGRYRGKTPLTLTVRSSRMLRIKIVKACYVTGHWRWRPNSSKTKTFRLVEDLFGGHCKKGHLFKPFGPNRKVLGFNSPHHPVKSVQEGPGFSYGQAKRLGRNHVLPVTAALIALSSSSKTSLLNTLAKRFKKYPPRVARSFGSMSRSELRASIKQAYNDIKKQPMNWSLRDRLANLLVRAKRRRELLAALVSWRRYAPDNPHLIIRESKLLKELGLKKESLRVLSELVEFTPHAYHSRLTYARELQARSHIPATCQQLTQAVRLNPSQRNTFREMMKLHRRYPKSFLRKYANACVVHGVSHLPVVRDISVVMVWDDPSADVDLHITEPSGETVYYSHRESRQGGTLYYDITDGFGPEIYVLGTAKKGMYRLAANYFNGTRNTVQGKLIIMRHAGSPNETRQIIPFILSRYGHNKKRQLARIYIK